MQSAKRRRDQNVEYIKWTSTTDEIPRDPNPSYAVGFPIRWKNIFQYVRMSYFSENVKDWSSSPQVESELSP